MVRSYSVLFGRVAARSQVSLDGLGFDLILRALGHQ